MPNFSPIIFLSAVVLVLPWVSQLPNCRCFNNSILISPSSAQLSRTHSIRAQTLQLTWTNFTSPSRSRSCTSHWRNLTRPISQWVTDSFSSTIISFHQLHYKAPSQSPEDAQSNLCNYLPAKSAGTSQIEGNRLEVNMWSNQQLLTKTFCSILKEYEWMNYASRCRYKPMIKKNDMPRR